MTIRCKSPPNRNLHGLDSPANTHFARRFDRRRKHHQRDSRFDRHLLHRCPRHHSQDLVHRGFRSDCCRKPDLQGSGHRSDNRPTRNQTRHRFLRHRSCCRLDNREYIAPRDKPALRCIGHHHGSLPRKRFPSRSTLAHSPHRRCMERKRHLDTRPHRKLHFDTGRHKQPLCTRSQACDSDTDCRFRIHHMFRPQVPHQHRRVRPPGYNPHPHGSLEHNCSDGRFDRYRSDGHRHTRRNPPQHRPSLHRRGLMDHKPGHLHPLGSARALNRQRPPHRLESDPRKWDTLWGAACKRSIRPPKYTQ